jgi:hypothetical protein
MFVANFGTYSIIDRSNTLAIHIVGSNAHRHLRRRLPTQSQNILLSAPHSQSIVSSKGSIEGEKIAIGVFIAKNHCGDDLCR